MTTLTAWYKCPNCRHWWERWWQRSLFGGYKASCPQCSHKHVTPYQLNWPGDAGHGLPDEPGWTD